MLRKNGLFAVICCIVSAGLSWGQTLSPAVREFVKIDAPVVALTHVRVIDGTGGAVREDQMIVLKQGKIESVSDAASASVPQDARLLDLHGETVIPGLAGMHEHMFYPVANGSFGEMSFSFPRLYLAGGVTTIRTAGSLEPYTDLEIKKKSTWGKCPDQRCMSQGRISRARDLGLCSFTS